MKQLSVVALFVVSACASQPRFVVTTPERCQESFNAITVEKVTVSPTDELVWREEIFELPGTPAAVFPAFLEFAKHLEDLLPGTKKIAGVHHNTDLTPEGFPAIGSQRLVCLTEGNFALEEVVERDEHGFRYVVSNYSLDVAKPILYGMGEFHFAPKGEHTQVTWRYSFKLRSDVFPGSFGGLGRSLFRSSFLDSDYAEFMRSGVVAMKAWGEKRVAK